MRASVLVPIAFALAALLVWQGAVSFFDVPEYLLPAPSEVLATFDSNLLLQLGVTFSEALAGFSIASVLAFCLAVLLARFKTLEQGFFPIAIAIKTTPLVAVAPLLVLWQGTGWWSKITAASLICFFPVLVNTVKGLKAADTDFHELFRSMGASKGQEFKKLRIPFSLPYLFSALKISSSLAVVGAIVGEFVGATKGLGYLIMVSSAHLETPSLFSAIFASAAAGIVLFYAIEFGERLVVFWQPSGVE
jgi:NitT/TauT family transport system permease protein